MGVLRARICWRLLVFTALATSCSFDASVPVVVVPSNSDGAPIVDELDASIVSDATVDATPPDAQLPACLMDSSYVERTGSSHRYHYEASGLFYDQSQSFCAESGAHLVVIDDTDENDFVATLGGSPWIGINDLEVEGSFAWVTSAAVIYSNWSSSEPNDSGGDEDCALSSGGNWNDGECSNLREFVCECDPMRLTPPPPDCMTSSAYSRIYQGRRYRWEPNPTNYAAAQTSCASEGGHLVVVTDDTENGYVQDMISEAAWIGYSDGESEGNFIWGTGSASSYTNWGSGQPDNNSDEDCAEANTNGNWNDLNCSANRAFVCECDPFVTLDTLGAI